MASLGVKRACEGVLPACQYAENNGGTAIRPFFASLVELDARASDSQRLSSWRSLQDRGMIFERYCSSCPVLGADQVAEGAALLALARSAVATGAPTGNPLFRGVEAHASPALASERQLLRDARAARLKLASLPEGFERIGALLALDPARASRRLGARVAAGEISAPVARGLVLSYEAAARGAEAEIARHRQALDDPASASPRARRSADARHDELTYLSKFRARVRGLKGLVDPRNGRPWAVAAIEENAPLPEAAQAPIGIASRFVLSARTWWLFGMARPRLVVEARTLARTQRYETLGYDDEPFGVDAINDAIDEKRAGGPLLALALVSLTGWSADAIARAHQGWDDPSLMILLVDAHSGEVHAHDALRASHDAIMRLFIPESGAEESQRARHAVRDQLLLAVHDEVSARDVARASGMSGEAIVGAMGALATQGWGVVEKRKDGVGFRRLEGKDLGELS